MEKCIPCKVTKWNCDGPQPIHLPEVIRCFNFFVLNHGDSKIAISKVAERFEKPYNTILDFLSRQVDANQDRVFATHCQELSKLISQKTKTDTTEKRIRDNAFKVVIDCNLPVPIEECWIENNLYDFDYYCANVFWPKVIDKFVRIPCIEVAQENQMINDETAYHMLALVLLCPSIVGSEAKREDYRKGMIGRTVVTKYNGAFNKIAEVAFGCNPKQVMKVRFF